MNAGVWLERTDTDPITVNEAIRANPHTRRREIAGWRTWARETATGWDPINGPVTVVVHHFRATTRHPQDAGSVFFAVKGVIDGLADAGVLPDGDGPDVVRSITFLAQDVIGRAGLRVIVRPVEQHHTKDQPSPTERAS